MGVDCVSWYCVDRVVLKGMSQVWRRSEVGNNKRRTDNTRLSSGTFQHTSSSSRNVPGRMIRSDLFWYWNDLKMKPTYRDKNLPKKIRRVHPLHRYEFGPPKFFSKTFRFSMIYYSTWQISGEGQWRKACRSRKKESKQSEITWKQSEPVRSISKIEKRREFVRALWHEQYPKNSFKWLYTLKG